MLLIFAIRLLRGCCLRTLYDTAIGVTYVLGDSQTELLMITNQLIPCLFRDMRVPAKFTGSNEFRNECR